jgi:hypothetical protein
MMKRHFLLLSTLVSLIAFLGCETAPPAAVEVEPAMVVAVVPPPSFSVRYNPNGATAGTVPEDSTNYIQGATVDVLGNNAGTLVNQGFAFNGWSRLPNGNGDVYDARAVYGPASFKMGSQNVTLYAVWRDPIVGPWNLTSVNGMAVSLAPAGFQTMMMTATEETHAWIVATTPPSGGATVTSSGTWAVAKTPTNYTFSSANIVTFDGVLNGTTLTLTPTTVGDTQVMVFSKQ